MSAKELRKVPAVRGLAWITGSIWMIRKQPLRLMLISLFLQFLLSLSQADAVGLLIILCLPALSAGMLQALHIVLGGGKPLLATLFQPFTSMKTLSPLLLLGGVVMVLGLLIVSLILSGEVVDINPELLSRIEQGDIDALQQLDPRIIEKAIIAMIIGAAVSGSISYFSVPLIWFDDQTMGKSISIGLRALARNWRPLLVVGFVLGLLAAPIIVLFSLFYLSTLSEGMGSTLLAFMVLLLGPVFQLLLFGTQYLAFRDIFGQDTAGN